MVSDLTSLLIYIVSGGASVIASRVLEQFHWFKNISPNGRMVSVFGVSAVLALIAVFLQSIIARNPFINEAVDPYVKALLPIVNILAAQIGHGMAKTQEFRALKADSIRGDS